MRERPTCSTSRVRRNLSEPQQLLVRVSRTARVASKSVVGGWGEADGGAHGGAVDSNGGPDDVDSCELTALRLGGVGWCAGLVGEDVAGWVADGGCFACTRDRGAGGGGNGGWRRGWIGREVAVSFDEHGDGAAPRAGSREGGGAGDGGWWQEVGVSDLDTAARAVDQDVLRRRGSGGVGAGVDQEKQAAGGQSAGSWSKDQSIRVVRLVIAVARKPGEGGMMIGRCVGLLPSWKVAIVRSQVGLGSSS